MGLRLSAKANCFVLGLSDTYPGFTLASSDEVRVEYPCPGSRTVYWRFRCSAVVLVPFFIFLFVFGLLVWLVFWVAWIPVLLIGQYPEGLFNLMVYAQRLQLRLSAFTFGL